MIIVEKATGLVLFSHLDNPDFDGDTVNGYQLSEVEVLPKFPPQPWRRSCWTWDGQAFAMTSAYAQEVAQRDRDIKKTTRADTVARIKVTTSSGKVFDGDEVSQTRMVRAVIGMQAAGAATITWTLADNTRADVSAAELSEALILAGQAQGVVWPL